MRSTSWKRRGRNVGQLSRGRNGRLWFCIQGGGYGSYDGKKFTAIGDPRWTAPGANADAIFAARDGAVWTGSVAGWGRWVEGKPQGTLFSNSPSVVITIWEDAAGRIWIGTPEHGLYYWENGGLKLFPDDELEKRNIKAIAQDTTGNLWVGTNEGLYRYDAQFRRKEIFFPGTQTNAILVDSHGVVWAGTSELGLGRYQDGKFTLLQKTDGLCNDNVTSLFEDAEGSLWVGTVEGLSQLTDLKFPIFSSKEGLFPGEAIAVAASRKGGLWIAMAKGASYFDGHTATNYNDPSLLPNSYVRRVFEAKNGDVYLCDGDRNICVPGGARYANEMWPEAFAEDAVGLLAGIGPALYRLEAGRIVPFQFEGQAPDFNWFNGLCVAQDGALWAATNNGLFRIEKGRARRWSTAEGLGSDRVHFVLEDVDGSIWGGSPTGLVRIKGDRVTRITSGDGLSDDRIFAIVPDDCGFFWLASGRGILRISRRSLTDFAEGRARRVACEAFNGLNSVKFNDRTDQGYSGCKTADGRIWFPNPQGVVMIDPARVAMNRIEPPVHIDRVLANGRDLGAGAVVPPGKGDIELHFSALSFIVPQRVRFQYQLDGYDRDWVDAGNRRLAFYTNLKPGRYTFRVIAANADGVWNRAGDTLGIQLLPHFHQTAWFYALCGGSLVAVLGGAYLWRIRLLNRRHRALQKARDELEVEVQKRTGELAAANTSLKREIEDHQRAETELEQRTLSLEKQIEERRKMQLEIDRVHRELLETSRSAGMAEVATGVLHNVGNVLNSVNISATLVADHVRHSKALNLTEGLRAARSAPGGRGRLHCGGSQGPDDPRLPWHAGRRPGRGA